MEPATNEEIPPSAPENRSALAGPRARQIGSTEQSSITGIPAFLRIRHSKLRPLVLFRTPTRSESDRCDSIPHAASLEQLRLAPSTINQRLAAVRRLAYEASDAGLLSPELAAGIKRVKGVKQLGVRLGNWLTAALGRALIEAPSVQTLRGKRDRAMLAVLLGCGPLSPASIVSLLRRTLNVVRFLRISLGWAAPLRHSGLPVASTSQHDHEWKVALARVIICHARIVPLPDSIGSILDGPRHSYNDRTPSTGAWQGR
jgi:hypothetical protein